MSQHSGVAVIGAGGHAKVVISTLLAAGHSIAAVFDDDAAKWETQILGVPVIGPVAALRDRQVEPAVIAIGNNAKRREIAETFDLRWITAVHPAAYVHPSVKLGAGSVVFAGAVIQPDAAIGEHVIVNTGATIDHDCVIGDFAHIAPGAHLAGDVGIGEGAFLGIGCAVIPGIRIGSWTTVGAGGVVVRDLPERVIATGIPAKPQRRVNHK